MMENGKSPGWIRAIKSLDSCHYDTAKPENDDSGFNPVYIAVALLGGLLIANKSLSPIIQITKTENKSRKTTCRKGSIIMDLRTRVGELAETFDHMLDRLKESFHREKRFSSDVSHELRTPVTAIMVSAESSLNRNETVDEYRESMEAILKESKIMSTMISQLLMMARGSDAKNVFELEPSI
jgi:signal transduction histidine kinase